MKSALIRLLFLVVLVGCTPISTAIKPTGVATEEWHAITQTSKPWSRWWWHGSQVTRVGITAELEAYKAAGFGGLELTPIYGVIGEEDEFIHYLSPEWMELLEYTLQEAKRLGLEIDMATGTGWPFGGPWVGADHASKYLAHKSWKLSSGEILSEEVVFQQSPIVRTVFNRTSQWYDQQTKKGKTLKNIPKNIDWQQFNKPPMITDLVDPIASNTNLQQLAPDQVRFSKALPLLSLMAFSDSGEVLDLKNKVSEKSRLDWAAPDGNWTLYALFQGWHGKMVERAAPGGEGNVIDHFSTQAIQQYLSRFDQAFEGRDLSGLRAFFNDSYEVDDAQGQADWTPNLLAEFEKRRGYDLQLHLPALFGKDTEEHNQRVLSDYRETLSDLILETFTAEWNTWAKSKSKITRNQAHGSPANILDLYAASDIPETEGTDIIRAKFATSAANVTGKALVSCEAATWLSEHFTSNLADLKENLDRYLVSGVNHIFYHGSCYSPQEEPWPGRLFYAAIHANSRNPLWRDLPVLNEYVARAQSILQSGQSDNDMLLYFPIYDRFATPATEMLDHLDAHGPRLEASQVKASADFLVEKGYTFDFISDRQIQKLDVRDQQLWSADNTYQSIILPETSFLPLSTFEKLLSLAENGSTIIIHKKLPDGVPGLGMLQSRQQQFQKNIDGLSFQSDATNEVKEAKIGAGRILLGNDLEKLLNRAGIQRETLVDEDLEFVRRKTSENTYYFISNWSGKAVNKWIKLQQPAKQITILSPMNGEWGVAKTRNHQAQSCEVLVQLAHGGSLFLKTSKFETEAPAWKYWEKTGTTVALEGNWRVQFLDGGPTLPAALQIAALDSWTSQSEESYQSFSGTARYRLTFARPTANSAAWMIDLGQVHESARIVLNGQALGTLIGPSFQVQIDADLLQDQNTLEIDVTNLMANRIADLDKRGVFWKKFYNINLSAQRRENLGEAGVFDTSDWEPLPSGLLGPVYLEQLKIGAVGSE